MEAGAAKAAAAEARWALTGARAEATTRVVEADTAKDIVVLLRVARGGSGRRQLRSGRGKSANLIKLDKKLRGIVKAFVMFRHMQTVRFALQNTESPRNPLSDCDAYVDVASRGPPPG